MVVFFKKSNENTYPKGRALMQMYRVVPITKDVSPIPLNCVCIFSQILGTLCIPVSVHPIPFQAFNKKLDSSETKQIPSPMLVLICFCKLGGHFLLSLIKYGQLFCSDFKVSIFECHRFSAVYWFKKLLNESLLQDLIWRWADFFLRFYFIFFLA